MVFIDPDIEYLPVGYLSKLNAKAVGEKTYMVTHGGRPIAVMIPLADYLELQALLELPKAKAAGA